MASNFSLSTRSLANISARRPWTVVGLWVVGLVAAMFLTSTLLSDVLTDKFDFANNPESKQGFTLIEERLRGEIGTNEVVIVDSTTRTVDDPAFQQAVTNIYQSLTALGPDVIRQETLSNYYQERNQFLVSEDRKTTVIPFTMAGDFDQASDNIDKVAAAVDEAKGQQTEFKVLMTGQATVSLDFKEVSEKDLQKGEAFGVPIALIILVIVFGAVIAALVPLALAIASIMVALGAAAIVGQAYELSFFVTNFIFMIGLAVGIDYCLFIIARYREERAKGLDKVAAITKTGNTASRAVFFSGMTVLLALVGMVIVPSNVYIALGLGAIFVVVASVAASLTLLPAILSLLGDKLNWLTIPVIGKGQAHFDQDVRSGFWNRLSRGVMARPFLSLLVAGGLLVAALIPFFSLHIGFAGVSTFPDGIESKEAFLILEEKFAQEDTTPAEIVIDGDANSPAVLAAVDRLKTRLEGDDVFGAPRELEVNSAGDLGVLAVPVMGDSASKESQEAIRRLRSDYVPEAFAGVPVEISVTGETAFNIDFFDMAKGITPYVFVFVLGVSFLLLMVVFRSIVVPAKAIALNLLSVGATYGIVVLIFQDGVLADVLGFQQHDSIEAWIPLFLFSVLFGLSMDYHVFLLSRIRERYDQTKDNAESVAFGIRSTGRLITGAALIMVAVFWSFAAGDLVGLQQMGFGLGLAVLIDATIVRSVLVPASMKLLGNWNWYLPNWLGWLPDLRVEGPKSSEIPAVAGGSDD
ncbi:MAG: MMPL family transporter [SAR202 cluster bacterium]|nr:MMPL family transporter [SAR202 cluster bacterium]